MEHIFLRQHLSKMTSFHLPIPQGVSQVPLQLGVWARGDHSNVNPVNPLDCPLGIAVKRKGEGRLGEQPILGATRIKSNMVEL